MKKLDESIMVKYPPLQIYQDDLEQIVEVLNTSAQDVEIKAGGYQFDSVAELVSNLSARFITDLELSARKPYVDIELTKMWGRVYISSSENTSAGVFYNIDKVFKSARRRLWPMYNYGWFLVIGIAFSALQYFSGRSGILLLGIVTIVFLSWMARVSFVRLRRHCVIWLSLRGKCSIWDRKRDDIIISGISAVVGAVFGIIGTLVYGYFSQ